MFGGDWEDDMDVWVKIGGNCGFVVESKRTMWECGGDWQDDVAV